MLAQQTHVCRFDPHFDMPTSDILPRWRRHVSKWYVGPTLAAPLPTAFCVVVPICWLTYWQHVGPTNTCQSIWPPFWHADIQQSQGSWPWQQNCCSTSAQPRIDHDDSGLLLRPQNWGQLEAMSYQKLPWTPKELQRIIPQYQPKQPTEISCFDWIQLVGLNDW